MSSVTATIRNLRQRFIALNRDMPRSFMMPESELLPLVIEYVDAAVSGPIPLLQMFTSRDERIKYMEKEFRGGNCSYYGMRLTVGDSWEASQKPDFPQPEQSMNESTEHRLFQFLELQAKLAEERHQFLIRHIHILENKMTKLDDSVTNLQAAVQASSDAQAAASAENLEALAEIKQLVQAQNTDAAAAAIDALTAKITANTQQQTSDTAAFVSGLSGIAAAPAPAAGTDGSGTGGGTDASGSATSGT